jgi:hypothetical protein
MTVRLALHPIFTIRLKNGLIGQQAEMHFPKVVENRHAYSEITSISGGTSKVLDQGYCLAGTHFGTVNLFISQHLKPNIADRWK